MPPLIKRALAWISIQAAVLTMLFTFMVHGVSAQETNQTLEFSGQTDAVTIDEGGTWTVSGDLNAGLVIDVGDEDITLILDGVAIANSNGPAIAFLSAGEVTIELAADSSNTVADGGEPEMDAAIWADSNLTIAGEGTLDVTAVNEGIETTGNITVDGGTTLIHAYDDGLNANTDGQSQIVINDGTVFVETEVGDGIDSNGGIEINGGTVIAYGALVDGNSGLDADMGVVVNGGTVVASGSQMASIDQSAQQSAVLATFDGTLTAGTGVVLMANDEVVIAIQPSVDVQSLIISTPGIDTSVTYTLLTGGNFEVDATTHATGTVTDTGTASGSVSTNVGGMGRP